MQEITLKETTIIYGGIAPALVVAGYYLYAGSSISGVYAWCQWMQE